MKILIAGDIVINRDYDLSNINSSILSLFKQSTLNILNLEAPVTDSNSKILKTGPHLKLNKKSSQEVLEALNIDIVTLANNHILDYKDQGVSDTLLFCEQNKINTVGAGMNIVSASHTLYIDTIEGKIAILNFAENEWASATDVSAGAHPMNLIDNIHQIKEARDEADYVFVIVHGGHEFYKLPSPRMQKQYRFYADNGADIVIGHHTHCISGYEEYNGVPIFYSLGNFLFTKDSKYEDWYKGMILELEIKEQEMSFKIHFTKQDKKSFQLSLFNDKGNKLMKREIMSLNKIIQNNVALNKEWLKYTKSKYYSYLNYFSPLHLFKNKYIRIILFKLNIRMINRIGMSLVLNMLRCESHNDMSKEVMKKYLSK